MRAATLARLSFVVLAGATFFAIFYAQYLKRQIPLLQYANPPVAPLQPAGRLRPHVHRDAHFKLRTSVTDTLVVSIVSERTGRVVYVLAPVRFHAYHHRPLSWDGRSASGTPAPVGVYALRVHFEHADQTVSPPLRIRLEGPPA